MIIKIPPAALEAGARELARIYELEYICDIDREWPEFVPQARAAFLAMLAAWPGMSSRWVPSMVADDYEAIILPLPPQEASDE